MKPSMLRQNQIWIRIEKQQELPLDTMQVPVANNNFRYNLDRMKKTKKKKKKIPNF